MLGVDAVNGANLSSTVDTEARLFLTEKATFLVTSVVRDVKMLRLNIRGLIRAFTANLA